jgi:uncharacterized protein YceH (UPF0502 family)
MAGVADVAEVDVALRSLAEHTSGPFVTRLPRLPGTRDARYGQLLTGEYPDGGVPEPAAEPASAAVPRTGLAERVATLEAQVADLQQALAALRDRQA